MKNKMNKVPTILIIGAGPGGLSLAHALEKNKDIKQFNVKIFERELNPTARWQGYHLSLYSTGINSLIQCIPNSLIPHISEAIPDPDYSKEDYVTSILTHTGHKITQKFTYRRFSNFIEFAKYPLNYNEYILCYRDKLRDILLQGIEVQWGKKCVGYEEVENGVFALFEDGTREFGDLLVACDGINSVVRKQKLSHLKIQNSGTIHVLADIAPSQKLISRLQKYTGNSFIQVIFGPYNDCYTQAFRMIPINDDRESEIRYRMSLSYSYKSHFDQDINNETTSQIVNEIKANIKSGIDNELGRILSELWDLVPLDDSVDPYPFKKFNPPRKRFIRYIDPKSISPWESTRVTLLGDAIHATSPFLGLGTNIAFNDSEMLSKLLLKMDEIGWKKCVRLYEDEMRQRVSKKVMLSIKVTHRVHGINAINAAL